MPLIPSSASFPEILTALGIGIDKADGDEISALCPMHEKRTGRQDSRPSWSINTEKGTHHCFSCGYSGHIVGLVADMLDIDFRAATRWLRRAGVDLELAQNLPSYWQTERSAKPKPKPRPVALERFVEPPDSALEKRGISRASAAFYGLLWDEERRGWILPIWGPEGDLMGYQYKRKHVVRNRPMHMEKSLTLFGIDCFRGGKAILVESPLDCAVLKTMGIDGALSSFGAAVSDTQMRLIVERADEVLLALDNDYAGRTETRRLVTGVRWRGAGESATPEKGIKWAARIPMSVFNYGEVEAKDVGEMQRADVYRGVREAKHSTELGWASKSRNSTTAKKATARRAASAARSIRASGSRLTRSGRRR